MTQQTTQPAERIRFSQALKRNEHITGVTIQGRSMMAVDHNKVHIGGFTNDLYPIVRYFPDPGAAWDAATREYGKGDKMIVRAADGRWTVRTRYVQVGRVEKFTPKPGNRRQPPKRKIVPCGVGHVFIKACDVPK